MLDIFTRGQCLLTMWNDAALFAVVYRLLPSIAASPGFFNTLRHVVHAAATLVLIVRSAVAYLLCASSAVDGQQFAYDIAVARGLIGPRAAGSMRHAKALLAIIMI
jgi:hypothetical protein